MWTWLRKYRSSTAFVGSCGMRNTRLRVRKIVLWWVTRRWVRWKSMDRNAQGIALLTATANSPTSPNHSPEASSPSILRYNPWKISRIKWTDARFRAQQHGTALQVQPPTQRQSEHSQKSRKTPKQKNKKIASTILWASFRNMLRSIASLMRLSSEVGVGFVIVLYCFGFRSICAARFQ